MLRVCLLKNVYFVYNFVTAQNSDAQVGQQASTRQQAPAQVGTAAQPGEQQFTDMFRMLDQTATSTFEDLGMFNTFPDQ